MTLERIACYPPAASHRRHALFARARPGVMAGPGFLPPGPYAATWANVGGCVPALSYEPLVEEPPVHLILRLDLGLVSPGIPGERFRPLISPLST